MIIIKEKRLIFNGLGYFGVNQAYVKIYDENYELVVKEKTFNGILYVNLEENRGYYLCARSKREILKIKFYVDRENNYVFYFPRSFRNNRKIIFHLTDSYYENLKIAKGEIIFG